jgi:uncharacterized protein (TIGR02246 family)
VIDGVTRALLATGLWAAIACRSVESSDVASARACVDRLVEADNARDLDAAMQCYTRDALLVPPQGAEIRGRDAVRGHYATIFAAVRPELRVEHLETTRAGGDLVDRGRTLGSVVPLDGAPRKAVDDEYEATLRREDGDWRVAILRWRPRSR